MFIGFYSRYITFYFILFYLNNQFKAYKGWFAPELLCSQTLPSSPTTTKSSPSDPMTTSRANQVQYHPIIYTILFTSDCLHTGEKDNGGLRRYLFIHICVSWSIPTNQRKDINYSWTFLCILTLDNRYTFRWKTIGMGDFLFKFDDFMKL